MNIDDFGKNSLLDLKRKDLLRKANGKSFIVVFSIYSIVILIYFCVEEQVVSPMLQIEICCVND